MSIVSAAPKYTRLTANPIFRRFWPIGINALFIVLGLFQTQNIMIFVVVLVVMDLLKLNDPESWFAFFDERIERSMIVPTMTWMQQFNPSEFKKYCKKKEFPSMPMTDWMLKDIYIAPCTWWSTTRIRIKRLIIMAYTSYFYDKGVFVIMSLGFSSATHLMLTDAPIRDIYNEFSYSSIASVSPMYEAMCLVGAFFATHDKSILIDLDSKLNIVQEQEAITAISTSLRDWCLMRKDKNMEVGDDLVGIINEMYTNHIRMTSVTQNPIVQGVNLVPPHSEQKEIQRG